MSLETQTLGVIAFGVFRLDVAKGELKRLGTTLHLAPQPFQLLVLLASRLGEVVTREEIQQDLWGSDVFVDFERGLNHCVRQIRAVLGDDAGAPAYIETVPRTGYRFVAPVTVVGPPNPAEVRPVDLHAAAPQPGDGRVKPWKGNRRRQIAWVASIALMAGAGLLLAFHRKHEARLATPLPRQIVAVLPFENLTGDPGQEYLSDGVTDEMIVHLCRDPFNS
jgi:DNA-binding winged helix-turn-helix (wHTH) protein